MGIEIVVSTPATDYNICVNGYGGMIIDSKGKSVDINSFVDMNSFVDTIVNAIKRLDSGPIHMESESGRMVIHRGDARNWVQVTIGLDAGADE